MGRYPSGQREQTVNLLAQPSGVRIPLSPPLLDTGDPIRSVESGQGGLLGGSSQIDSRESYVNLIISAQSTGPFLENSMNQWFGRVPIKRHPRGALGVVFADFHGQSVKPTAWKYNGTAGFKLPDGFSPKVRVSPYRPFPR